MEVLAWFFSFSGRFTRLEWWLSRLIMVVAALVLGQVIATVKAADAGDAEGPLAVLGTVALALSLITAWMSLATSAKRFRDAGWSPLCCLFAFIPFIGGLLELAVCGFFTGDESEAY